MNIHGRFPTLLTISILVAMASTHFISLNFSLLRNHLIDLSLITFSSTTGIKLGPSKLHCHHHHHHHHRKDNEGSICDDFPRDFPPPDTNTTSVICVDPNGCCNFTTVQSALDAVRILSQKRTIIWINSGIYLWVVFHTYFSLFWSTYLRSWSW